MNVLTNEQKLFVLYTKGYFSKYEDAKEVILAEVFHVYPKDIHEGNAVSFMINLFSKLAETKSIEMNYEQSLKWLLREFSNIGSRPHAPQSLHDWLHSRIQGCLSQGLDLNDVDRAIENKMTLINNAISEASKTE